MQTLQKMRKDHCVKIGCLLCEGGDEVKIPLDYSCDSVLMESWMIIFLLSDRFRNTGTEEGYTDGYLRASTCEPFSRANLKDTVGYNLPAIIHFDIVTGDKIDIEYAAKGGGSENVSRARVFLIRLQVNRLKAIVEYVKSEKFSNVVRMQVEHTFRIQHH